MPFGLGFGELLLISLVMLMLFGAKRLPEVAAGMGKGIRDFKRSLNGIDEPSILANPQQAPPVQAPPVATAAPVEAPAKQAEV